MHNLDSLFKGSISSLWWRWEDVNVCWGEEKKSRLASIIGSVFESSQPSAGAQTPKQTNKQTNKHPNIQTNKYGIFYFEPGGSRLLKLKAKPFYIKSNYIKFNTEKKKHNFYLNVEVQICHTKMQHSQLDKNLGAQFSILIEAKNNMANVTLKLHTQ